MYANGLYETVQAVLSGMGGGGGGRKESRRGGWMWDAEKSS